METAQGNSLCSYLYIKVTKTSSSSFYLLCFFFYKIGEQEHETGSVVLGWVLALVGGGMCQGKG
jgi:hypothetical protein